MTSIKKSTISGVKWTTVSTIVNSALQTLKVILLARLLSPSDFGLMAMLLVVTGFSLNYADFGTSNAIIYRQDVTRNQLSSLYWLNIASSFGVFFLMIAATPLIVHIYNEPRLSGLIFWAALYIVIVPIGQQFQNLLQKELRFQVLAWVDMISALIGVVIAIGSAMVDPNVFSLIWGQLGATASKALMLFAIGCKEWRPTLHFSREDLKGYISFGLYQMGEKSINYFNLRMDQIMIGALLGAQELGYYNLAFNLVIQPVARINPILTRVAFPVFAKIQSDIEHLKKWFFMVLKVISVINFPVLLGCAAVAPVLVPIVFGKQWLPSVVFIQILSIVALTRSTMNPVGSLILAKGRPDLGFKWNLLPLFIQVPGMYLGYKIHGALGIAVALVIVHVVYILLNYAILIRTLVGHCLKDYIASIVPSLIISLMMGAFVLAFGYLFYNSTIFVLVLQILLGLGLYFLFNFIFQRQYLFELKNLVFSKDSIES